MIVADTDLIAYLLIEGNDTPAARQVFARDPEWRAPPLWRSEFLNILLSSVRADVLDESSALRAWGLAASFMRGSEVHPRAEAVLQTAVRDGLSAYDAQFVVVAEELGVTMVTADRRVLAARPDRAISIERFGKG